MPWNPAILRKYSTTGHFRLLNQLRSELRANPMPRAHSSDAGGETASGGGRSPIRTLQMRPRVGGGSSFRTRRPLQSAGAVASSSGASVDSEQNTGRTFRERLNAIDMR